MDIDTKQHLLEAASNGASRAIASGATVALYGGYSATEIAAFGGLITAMLGLIWKLYVDHELLRLARQKQIEDTKFRELSYALDMARLDEHRAKHDEDFDEDINAVTGD